MEFIASEDVRFIKFFTEYLRYIVVTWDQFVDVCQQHCDTATSVFGLCDSSSDNNDSDSCNSDDWVSDHETEFNFQEGGLELDAGMKVVPETELCSPPPKRVCAATVLSRPCSSVEGDKCHPHVTPPSPPTGVSCTVLEGDKSPPPVTNPSPVTDVSCGVLEGDKSPPPVTHPSPVTDVSCGVLEAVMQCFAQLHLKLGNMAAKGLVQETQTMYKLLQDVLEHFSARG